MAARSPESFHLRAIGSTSTSARSVHVRQAEDDAAEDRRFCSNPGFSFSRFARAAKNSLFGSDLQGGSTITQQYVKNALVGSAQHGLSEMRKAKELVIATKMSVVQRRCAAGEPI